MATVMSSGLKSKAKALLKKNWDLSELREIYTAIDTQHPNISLDEKHLKERLTEKEGAVLKPLFKKLGREFPSYLLEFVDFYILYRKKTQGLVDTERHIDDFLDEIAEKLNALALKFRASDRKERSEKLDNAEKDLKGRFDQILKVPNNLELPDFGFEQDTSALPPEVGLLLLPFNELLQKANAGDATAMNVLGFVYETGAKGITINPSSALEMYLKAASAGDVKAIIRLAAIYQDGLLGQVPDIKKAIEYFEIAAARGETSAQNNLAWLLAKCSASATTSLSSDNRNDNMRILELYRQAAEKGNPIAQSNLASMLCKGTCGKPNYEQGVKWYQLSASSGNIHAQFMLGTLYMIGEGVHQDYVQAVKWLRLAAKKNSGAQCALGILYLEGKGVIQNFQESFKWFKMAAEQGLKYAQSYLSDAYYFGEGTAKDPKEAVRYATLAAEQGFAKAQYTLGVFYVNGYADLPVDWAKALMWFRKAAEQGDPHAQYNAAMILQKGDGLPSPNFVEAIKWFKMAAKQNCADSLYNLGTLYNTGVKDVLTEDVEKGYSLCLRAAELGHARAQHQVGHMIVGGFVKKDDKEAVKWLKRAVAQNYQEASFDLAILQLNGRGGMEKNENAAITTIKKFAEEGDSEAQLILGNYYVRKETLQDRNEAAKWFKRAVLGGKKVATLKYAIALFLTHQLEEAMIWAKKAKEYNVPNADEFLATVKQKMASEQFEQLSHKLSNLRSVENKQSRESKQEQEGDALNQSKTLIQEGIPAGLEKRCNPANLETLKNLLRKCKLKTERDLPTPELALRRIANEGWMEELRNLFMWVPDLNFKQTTSSGKTALDLAIDKEKSCKEGELNKKAEYQKIIDLLKSKELAASKVNQPIERRS